MSAEKETLIADLPEPTTTSPPTPSQEVESSSVNDLMPTSWKKMVLMAISYGIAMKLEETPGPLVSLLEKLPSPFIARVVLAVATYVVLTWVIKKFNLWDLE